MASEPMNDNSDPGRRLAELEAENARLRRELGEQRELAHHLREANEHLVLAAVNAQTSRDDAEETNRRQNEFLAMLAHELRNPLVPISVSASLLDRNPAIAGPLRKLTGVIGRQVGHMARLLDDLLDAARLSSGKITLAIQPLRLSEVLDQAVETVQPRLRERGQQLDVSLAAVDVVVDGAGLVRNMVTDPYSVSLNADSKRSYVADLDAANLKPQGWDATRAPDTVKAQTDMVIYELHVRDFSLIDGTVPEARRGKYGAFSETNSNGMKHLRALAKAGLTDIHLLPVYDIGSIPEVGCALPQPSGAPDGETQQALIRKTAHTDCFNWGYDPQHFNAVEGSYASDPQDGARRIVEFRQMVMDLHNAGLRVGTDVVYNHTFIAGQNEKSILDRVVPGYYHRLNATGGIESSTCCFNTATENTMMAKLMIDSAVLWTRHYKIDSFRFDLMGHQPRPAMERLQREVDRAAGRHVQLIGEGWNFGEVADGARFVQASQLSLNGSGIGTFSDRARDAVRGGSPGDSGETVLRQQGYINGLVYDPNRLGGGRQHSDLLKAADLIRVGLAGSVRAFPMQTFDGQTRRLESIVYGGNQPAGYASQPGEAVNYVENHDNQTLYDINVLKLPVHTSAAERARVQVLGMAINAFSQGVAYYHAGIDTLRSKSLDRNSFNSGDWFNRLDWTYQDNFFGTGLPPADDNAKDWPLFKPLRANAALKPAPADIAFARDAFRDLLQIRASTTLLRLRTSDDIVKRLRFFNTGPGQVPTVLAASIDGRGYPGARFGSLTYLVNVDKAARTVKEETLRGKRLRLHPVHTAKGAADKRAAQARYDSASGTFTIPARTAEVIVIE